MLPCDDQWSLSFWLQMIFCVVGVLLVFVGLAHIIHQILRRKRAKALQGYRAKVAEAQITRLELKDVDSGTHQVSFEFETVMPDDRVLRVSVKNRDIPRRVAETILPAGSTKLTENCTAPVKFLLEDPSCCMLACNADTQGRQTVGAIGLGMLGIVFGVVFPLSAIPCHGLSGIISALLGALLGVLYAYGVVTMMDDPLRAGITTKVSTKEQIQPSGYGHKIADQSQVVVDTVAA